jgi:hypothetical protein
MLEIYTKSCKANSVSCSLSVQYNYQITWKWNKISTKNCAHDTESRLNGDLGLQHLSMLLIWAVTPCGLLGRYHHFAETVPIRAEDRDSMFLRNVGIYLRAHTASQPRTTTATFSPLWELQFHIYNFYLKMLYGKYITKYNWRIL